MTNVDLGPELSFDLNTYAPFREANQNYQALDKRRAELHARLEAIQANAKASQGSVPSEIAAMVKGFGGPTTGPQDDPAPIRAELKKVEQALKVQAEVIERLGKEARAFVWSRIRPAYVKMIEALGSEVSSLLPIIDRIAEINSRMRNSLEFEASEMVWPRMGDLHGLVEAIKGKGYNLEQ